MSFRKRFFSGLLFLLVASSLCAQSSAAGFRKLSAPEKRWVIFHPFVADEAYRCSLKARTVTDSLRKAGVLNDGNGGQLDAYRHAYWMALLVGEMSVKKAVKLGRAHEKGNYRTFRKGGLEDSLRPDSMLCVMDLRNNDEGIRIGLKYEGDQPHCLPADTSVPPPLEVQVLHAVWNGELFILKKDAKGNWLDCNSKPIDLTLYDKKWYIPKCLVKSNEIIVPH